jgi:3-oxoacyl-[acyl-carrier protein] reductase
MAAGLQGRTAFVSGSTSGIGAAVAAELARAGAIIVVHGRDRPRGEAVAASIRDKGGIAELAIGDLDSDTAIASIADQTQQTVGAIDILVNVAGNAGTATWDTSTAAEFIGQYQTNTISAVRLIQRFLPHMRRQGWGRIVQISSIAAYRPLPNQVPAYCSAKAALLSMTTSLAMTVAADGVNVNCISPGFVLTPALKDYFLAMPDYAGRQWRDIEPSVAQTLGIRLGRLGRPADIASTVGYLVGPSGDWITGSNFRVDGGNLCSF